MSEKNFASKIRPLHWVFKIGDRKANIRFFRDILGMTTLRHEEFSEGCEATCNGPYDGKWSKTMIGYGSENDHFVVELTYNYNVESYNLGNDFRGMTIRSNEILTRAKDLDYPIKDLCEKKKLLVSPDGYKFFILDEPRPKDKDPIQEVKIGVSDLKESLDFWHKDLRLNLRKEDKKTATLDTKESAGVKIILEEDSGKKIDRGTAYGRIAFSVPYEDQPEIMERLMAKNRTILNPLITLPTPGKATVRVLIITDPDGQEICFVEDAGFRELSKPDPNPDELLDKSIAEDKSR